jgi:hypothetical protein
MLRGDRRLVVATPDLDSGIAVFANHDRAVTYGEARTPCWTTDHSQAEERGIPHGPVNVTSAAAWGSMDSYSDSAPDSASDSVSAAEVHQKSKRRNTAFARLRDCTRRDWHAPALGRRSTGRTTRRNRSLDLRRYTRDGSSRGRWHTRRRARLLGYDSGRRGKGASPPPPVEPPAQGLRRNPRRRRPLQCVCFGGVDLTASPRATFERRRTKPDVRTLDDMRDVVEDRNRKTAWASMLRDRPS